MKRLFTTLFLLPLLLSAATKYIGDFTGNGGGALGPITNIPSASIVSPPWTTPAQSTNAAITVLNTNGNPNTYLNGIGGFTTPAGGVSATDVTNAATTVVNGVIITNTSFVYVDKSGNDATGTRKRPDKPFLTISAALSAATNGDTIVISSGRWNESLIIHSNINYQMQNGCSVDGVIASNIIWQTDQIDNTRNTAPMQWVYGDGLIVTSNKYWCEVSEACSLGINVRGVYTWPSNLDGCFLHGGDIAFSLTTKEPLNNGIKTYFTTTNVGDIKIHADIINGGNRFEGHQQVYWWGDAGGRAYYSLVPEFPRSPVRAVSFWADTFAYVHGYGDIRSSSDGLDARTNGYFDWVGNITSVSDAPVFCDSGSHIRIHGNVENVSEDGSWQLAGSGAGIMCGPGDSNHWPSSVEVFGNVRGMMPIVNTGTSNTVTVHGDVTFYNPLSFAYYSNFTAEPIYTNPVCRPDDITNRWGTAISSLGTGSVTRVYGSVYSHVNHAIQIANDSTVEVYGGEIRGALGYYSNVNDTNDTAAVRIDQGRLRLFGSSIGTNSGDGCTLSVYTTNTTPQPVETSGALWTSLPFGANIQVNSPALSNNVLYALGTGLTNASGAAPLFVGDALAAGSLTGTVADARLSTNVNLWNQPLLSGTAIGQVGDSISTDTGTFSWHETLTNKYTEFQQYPWLNVAVAGESISNMWLSDYTNLIQPFFATNTGPKLFIGPIMVADLVSKLPASLIITWVSNLFNCAIIDGVPILAFTAPPLTNTAPTIMTNIHEVNNWVRQSDMWTKLVDLEAQFPDPANLTYRTDDGIHFQPEGKTNIADVVQHVLRLPNKTPVDLRPTIIVPTNKPGGFRDPLGNPLFLVDSYRTNVVMTNSVSWIQLDPTGAAMTNSASYASLTALGHLAISGNITNGGEVRTGGTNYIAGKLRVGGAAESTAAINVTGGITTSGGVTFGGGSLLYSLGRSKIGCPADGWWQFSANSESSFTGLILGCGDGDVAKYQYSWIWPGLRVTTTNITASGNPTVIIQRGTNNTGSMGAADLIVTGTLTATGGVVALNNSTVGMTNGNGGYDSVINLNTNGSLMVSNANGSFQIVGPNQTNNGTMYWGASGGYINYNTIKLASSVSVDLWNYGTGNAGLKTANGYFVMDTYGNLTANTNLTLTNGNARISGTLTATGGALFGSAALTTSTTTNGPAQNELATAGWVRGLLAGNGGFYYASANVDTGTNADTASQFLYRFNALPQAYSMRPYTNIPVNSYMGSVVTTNTFSTFQGPVVVNAWLTLLSSAGGRSISVKPEIYWSYDKTNWFGDWSATAQSISTGTNVYQWVIGVPTTTAPTTAVMYVERRFKVTATNGADQIIMFHVGTNGTTINDGLGSHISMSGPSSASLPNNIVYMDPTSKITNAYMAGLYASNSLLSVFDISNPRQFYSTNDNIAISGLTGMYAGMGMREASVTIKNTKAGDITLTIPNPWLTPDGLRVYTITNGQSAELCVKNWGAGIQTNAAVTLCR